MVSIYGIFDGDDCIYVGETTRPYKQRCNEHKRALAKGEHSNKTLQKYYDAMECKDNLRFEILSSIDTDNTLLKYFYESLYISLYKPKCNKCVLEQGKRNRVVLQRCEPDIAREIIGCIEDKIGVSA